MHIYATHIDYTFTYIEEYNETFSEITEVGSQIFRIVASDADSGRFGEITYSILSGNEVK